VDDRRQHRGPASFRDRTTKRGEAEMEQDEFTAFEHQGWEKVAQPYHTYFGDLTTQSNSALLDVLDIRPGVRFLDVASGLSTC
jgi:hypothetical protein